MKIDKKKYPPEYQEVRQFSLDFNFNILYLRPKEAGHSTDSYEHMYNNLLGGKF